MTPDNALPLKEARDAFSAFFFALLLVARALDASASAASCDFFLSSDSEKTFSLELSIERTCKSTGRDCANWGRGVSA
jgi:hypothetical protein